jgi:hypothetical protein
MALLYNLSGMLSTEARGTYYYAKDRVWNSFDSISVSPGMLPGADKPAAWQAATNTYAIYISGVQTNAAGRPLSYWRARSEHTSGRRRIGYSDHFPVRIELRAPPPEETTGP